MRILPFMPLHEGYEPSAVELNQEEGILDISHQSDCRLLEESKIIAEKLVLRCALSPLPLSDRTIKVQLTSEGETLEETPLYEEESVAYGYDWDVKNSQWQGIALEYKEIGWGVHQGSSFHFEGKTLPDGLIEIGQPLYLKPFKVQRQDHQERVTTLALGQVLVTPPGVLDTQVLRGYGGYYKEGIALEDIQQIYYGLTSTHTHTRVKLLTSSKLHEQHTPPPYGGKGFGQETLFHPTLTEEEYLSLPGAIAAGHARLVVVTEGGKSQFLSYLCESIPGHPTFVNVHFRP